jgi:hypothetical protein
MARGRRITVRLADWEIQSVRRFADENHLLPSVAVRWLLTVALAADHENDNSAVEEVIECFEQIATDAPYTCGTTPVTDTRPLKARLLFDTCIPITVDEVEQWVTPTLLIVAALEGMLIGSPQHLCKIWPQLFPNLTAAKRAVKKGLPILPGFVTFHYQVKGEHQPPRLAYYDPKLITDPLKWLRKRLKSPLAGVSV